MNTLLGIREKIRNFYASYDVYFRPVIRFALAVFTFMMINTLTGYLTVLNNLFVLIILSVICAILPLNGIVAIGTTLIVAHCFGLGVEVGGFALVLYLVMILMYFRFASRDAMALLMTPIAFTLHAPLAVPMALGLLRGPLSCITIACGVLSWKFIETVNTVIEPMKNTSTDANSMLDVLQTLPTAFLSKDMILTLITFVVVVLVVSAVRKLLSSHSWEIGMILGAILYIFLEIAGGIILGVEVNYIELIISTLISIAVCLVLQLFYYTADYKRSEYLQFEDDKNYYYVKVTPKLKPRFEIDEVPESDPSEEDMMSTDHFTEKNHTEFEKKFEGINLQSRLEESLKTLNANTNAGDTNTITMPEIPSGETGEEPYDGEDDDYVPEGATELNSADEDDDPSDGKTRTFRRGFFTNLFSDAKEDEAFDEEDEAGDEETPEDSADEAEDSEE